jgi:transposase
LREIDDAEGQRLLRIIRRGSGSVVTWRWAQMVLLSVQGMNVANIAEVTFTSPDRVRDVIHNFNADGFTSLYPKYKGGRPKTFSLPERGEIKKIAKSRPAEHGLPFSTWSLVKLADFLVAEGVVDDISHEGLRILLCEEGVPFQRLKTWKTSKDPDYAVRKARVEHLYAIADGEVLPEPSEPEVVFCLDEFGPLNLLPHPGRQWAERGGKHKDADREPPPRDLHPPARGPAPVCRLRPGQRPALRPHQEGQEPLQVPGVLPLPAFPPPRRQVHLAIVCDNYSPHLSTKRCRRVADWAKANNVEIAYTPTNNSSWLNRIEAQFTALRYFALDGTDHPTHKVQGSMIRRYIIWRNKNAADKQLRRVTSRTNVA